MTTPATPVAREKAIATQPPSAPLLPLTPAPAGPSSLHKGVGLGEKVHARHVLCLHHLQHQHARGRLDVCARRKHTEGGAAGQGLGS